jgi:predicted CoA-binding protein
MLNNRTTLIIGASNNPDRYSYRAALALRAQDIPIILFGVKRGAVENQPIENTWNTNWRPDTVTLYINAGIQEDYYEKIIALAPRRVIFNPGTENPTFQLLLKNQDIAYENACTLVLLSLGAY